MSFLLSLRASRRIGRGVRLREKGRHDEAMTAYGKALALMERVPTARQEEPWVLSSSAAALLGYARSASALGRTEDMRAALTRWRPRYEAWMRSQAQRPSMETLQALDELYRSVDQAA